MLFIKKLKYKMDLSVIKNSKKNQKVEIVIKPWVYWWIVGETSKS